MTSPLIGRLPQEDGERAPASEETIEAALDGAGFPWTKRASSWVVVVAPRLPREVLVVPAPGGARVFATLAEWDEIAPACSEGLERFLIAAQAGLRSVRCEKDQRRAQIVGFTAAETLDTDLVHALLGVAAGCDLLAREAEALLRPEVAETYLNCRRMP